MLGIGDVASRVDVRITGLQRGVDENSVVDGQAGRLGQGDVRRHPEDRKSTRLNSSHSSISYAVFCLKKKKKNENEDQSRRKQNKKKKATQKCQTALISIH